MRPGCPALVPKGSVGGHQEAGQLEPAGDCGHEIGVGRHPDGRIEMLDDHDLDPGSPETDEPFGRVTEDRRRSTDEDLIGVVIERDHGGPGAMARGRGAQAGQQERMAAMEPIERPDDEEEGPWVDTEVGWRAV